MTNITLPDNHVARRLSFFLAMEDFVVRQQLADDAFFLWQVDPSVIYGRNQVVDNEINLDYCHKHGIQIYQRKSGGGCVYADRDNLMLSFVTKEQQVCFAFNRFVNMLLLVLHKMGIDATGTRHNDILIGEKKVCGTACRMTPYGCIVHSTMLYDTNMQHMLQAITPSHEKLAKNGVESVRQRITLLKDYTSLNLEEIKTLIIKTLCDKEYRLTDADVCTIEELENNQIVK